MTRLVYLPLVVWGALALLAIFGGGLITDDETGVLFSYGLVASIAITVISALLISPSGQARRKILGTVLIGILGIGLTVVLVQVLFIFVLGYFIR